MAAVSEATIVVVEDDGHIADLVELYLRQEGFRVVQAATGLGLDVRTADGLVRQAGEQAHDVLSLVAADPTLGLVLSPSASHIAAEVVHAARAEGAMTLDDVYTHL